MKIQSVLIVVAGAVLALAACGGTTAPASQAASSAFASAAAKPGTAASVAASAKPAPSGKPAASGEAGPSIPAAKPGTITVAWVGASPSFAPLWIAIESGLLDKYGAPVQMVNTTAPPAMAGLLGGDVQIAIDGGAMVGADPSGQKLAFIAAQQNAFNQFEVYAKADIKSLAQLKGHTVGAASPGSAATVAFETILKSAGLDPKADVKWAYLGTPAAQWTALSNGNIDASINAFPYGVLAKQAGFNKLADAKDPPIPGASNVLGASRQWVKDHSKLVDSFLRGFTEGTYLANTDKAKFQAAVSKWTKVSDQAQLDDAWDRFHGTYPMPPYITTEAVQEAINDEPNPAVKGHKPEDYIDNAPLDALVASGFTKQFGT
jgi:ABC-type nitrate/sulfonate/bicarbonate transport system substrate-binding protein